MATTTTASAEDYINKMYDSSLSSEKAQLQTDYEQNVSDLEAQKEAAQKQTDTNLTRTYVEAAKNAKNYAEVQNAYGLTSGAMAQAKLAQNNQLQSDLTSLRTAQQTVDAEIERERGLLAKEYASAIAKAQADNDLARAQALYEQAKEDEESLNQKQKEAAALMAGAGDYSLYQALYGLTDAQVNKLNAAATGTATTGKSSSSGSSSASGYDNGGYSADIVKQAQDYIGVTQDGKWGPNSQSTMKKLGYSSIADVVAAMNQGTQTQATEKASATASATLAQYDAAVRAKQNNTADAYLKELGLI